MTQRVKSSTKRSTAVSRFNTLARFARHLKALYAELGVRGTIAFIRQSCAAPWLDPEQIRARLSQPFQLQLE